MYTQRFQRRDIGYAKPISPLALSVEPRKSNVCTRSPPPSPSFNLECFGPCFPCGCLLLIAQGCVRIFCVPLPSQRRRSVLPMGWFVFVAVACQSLSKQPTAGFKRTLKPKHDRRISLFASMALGTLFCLYSSVCRHHGNFNHCLQFCSQRDPTTLQQPDNCVAEAPRTWDRVAVDKSLTATYLNRRRRDSLKIARRSGVRERWEAYWVVG